MIFHLHLPPPTLERVDCVCTPSTGSWKCLKRKRFTSLVPFGWNHSKGFQEKEECKVFCLFGFVFPIALVQKDRYCYSESLAPFFTVSVVSLPKVHSFSHFKFAVGSPSEFHAPLWHLWYFLPSNLNNTNNISGHSPKIHLHALTDIST